MRRAPSAPAVTAVVVRCLVSLGSAARATRGLCFAAGNRPDYAAARAVRMRPLRVRGGGSRGVGLGAPDSAAPTTTFSIETTPKLSSGIETHRAFLPPGTPVYVAAIPGTSLTVSHPPDSACPVCLYLRLSLCVSCNPALAGVSPVPPSRHLFVLGSV